MSWGDLAFGSLIAGVAGLTIGILAGIVYVIVSVAKWTWGS